MAETVVVTGGTGALGGGVVSALLEAGVRPVVTWIVDAERDAVARQHAETMALRHFVEPEDVAAAVMFLAGPDGRNVTGQEIVVDAGAVV